MTLTIGLSAAAVRRRGIHTSRAERMTNRPVKGFMDETFSAIRQNKQALSGRSRSQLIELPRICATRSALVVACLRSVKPSSREVYFHRSPLKIVGGHQRL